MPIDATFVIGAKDRSKRALDSAGQGMDNFGSKFKTFGKTAALGLAAGGAALAGFAAKAVKDLVRTGDEFDKMAGRTGFAVEELSGLSFALEQSGSSLQTFERSQRNLNERLQKGLAGQDAFAERFTRIGLSLNELEKANPAERLNLVADALANIDNHGQRAAAAGELLGQKAGPELLNLLANGSEGIKALTDEAATLGRVISTETASNAAALGDSFNRLKSIGTGAATSLAAGLLPAVLEVTQALAERFQPLLDQLIPIIGQLVGALTPLTPILVGGIADVLETLVVPALELLADILSTEVGRAIALATGALIALNAAAAANPYAVIALAAAAAATLIIKNWEPIRNFFEKLVGYVVGPFTKVWDIYTVNLKRVINGYLKIFGGFANGVIAAINSIINAWNGLSFTLPSVSIPFVGTFGGQTIGTPNIPNIPEIPIPQLASGGIVTQPTLAVVGERGPEAVIPLSRMQQQAPINLSVTLELEGDALAEFMLERVNDGLRTNQIAAVRESF